MLRISHLYIYPIKSLGGIALDTARVTDRGLEHDRRWLLIGPDNVQLTQREFPAMALMKPQLTPKGLTVTFKPSTPRQTHPPTIPQRNPTQLTTLQLHISFQPATNVYTDVQCWDDTVRAQFVDPRADTWFSDILQTNCRLVYMPEETKRQTDLKYTSPGNITSFADGYPFLLIGQSSLDELNSRLEHPLPMDRFRPNIVFTGGAPFLEDDLHNFKIGAIRFSGVKLCARCPIPTIDQLTAERGKEPLRTLAKYRTRNHKVLFGQNLIHHDLGHLSIDDELIPAS
jgi:uncharacterized protein YcbX